VKTFDELYREVHVRSLEATEGSRTVELLSAGVHAIGKAIEIAQLLYHLQVMMVARGVSLEDVYRAL